MAVAPPRYVRRAFRWYQRTWAPGSLGRRQAPKNCFFFLRRRLLPQALTQVVTALAPPSKKRWWWNKRIKMYSTSGPVAQCRKNTFSEKNNNNKKKARSQNSAPNKLISSGRALVNDTYTFITMSKILLGRRRAARLYL